MHKEQLQIWILIFILLHVPKLIFKIDVFDQPTELFIHIVKPFIIIITIS